MTKVYQSINTLVLVNKVNKAEEIASHLRRTGIAIRQRRVSSVADFSAVLQREPVDLGIVYCNSELSGIPAAVLRYPDIPFIAMMSQYRNRTAEVLLEQGVSDVVGFSHPIRLGKVLLRTIAEAKLRRQNTLLEQQFGSQNNMLHTLLRGTGEAIAYLHQGMHSFSNPAYQQLHGLPDDEEVLRTPLLDLIDPADRGLIDRTLRELENGRQEQAEVGCFLHKTDGMRQAVTLKFSRSWFDGESVVQLIALPRSSQRGAALPVKARAASDKGQSGDSQHLLRAAGLQLSIEPVNSLRADLFERHYVHLRHENRQLANSTDLLIDDRSGMTLIDLDRCIILEAINQLTRRLRRNPNTRFLIPLHAEAAQHLGLTQWMQQHIQSRSIPSRAITLVMPLTGGNGTFAEHFELTRQMQLAGIGVCISGICGTTEEQLYLSTSDIDYAILNPQQGYCDTQQRLGKAAYERIRRQLKICQQANVKTMIAACHPADIATLWKLGVDCLIGDLESQLETATVC